jgi:Fic family protein
VSEDDQRHSSASDVQLIKDPQLLAQREAANGLRQFDAVAEMIESFSDHERPFKFRPSHLLHLHRIALDGLSLYAGNWRPANIEISGSKHKPVGAHQVPEHIELLCDYVNDNWSKTAVHLSSYVMWRLNWIHPFTDGNGRTSRATSYLILCLRIGYLLPGRKTIPEQIAQNKRPYYEALEAADRAWQETGAVDLSQMEALLESLLAKQLLEVMRDAGGTVSNDQTPVDKVSQ